MLLSAEFLTPYSNAKFVENELVMRSYTGGCSCKMHVCEDVLGPVRTGHIDIEFELISKYLRTIFEMPSTSNMVG